MKAYIQLMRLDKPIGILLLLWPTLWGLWLASDGRPEISTVVIFVVGVILMRSAGCIINDYADRNFDAHIARTAARPLANAKIHTRDALLFFAILCLVAFSLVLQLNLFTVFLSVIGVVLAVVYPFLKRFTHLPQIGLGFAFSWGIPMAFAAEKNAIPLSAWVLYFTALIWPVVYDTMYAMTDRDDDIKIGLKSTAILFASREIPILTLLQCIFLCGLGLVGYLFDLAFPFYLSLFMAAIFFYYQHWLIKKKTSESYFQAFLNNQWIGLIVFIGILIGLYS